MRRQPEKADALIDDVDDERANIMAYHHEGGGEEDQVKINNFNFPLFRDFSSLTSKIRPITILNPSFAPSTRRTR